MGDKPKAKDFLGMALGAIAIAASGSGGGADFSVVVVPGGKKAQPAKHLTIKRPSPQDARAYLAMLAGEMLSGVHDYYFPVEAVEDGHGDAAQSVEAAHKLRDHTERSGCSSDYGPIPNPHDFDPPHAERVREIVDKRFAPLRAIFAAAQKRRK